MTSGFCEEISSFLANEHLKLVDVNESFLKFFHYSKKEALSLKINDLFSSENEYNKFYSTLKEVEQVRDFDVSLVNKNGAKKACLVNCVFIPDQLSEFCCYQGIIHDQTMRKKAERDMLIAERLSMTGKIARTIAHEVRNPLTNLTLARKIGSTERSKSERYLFSFSSSSLMTLA